ncbi:MAG: ATP-grasp fold amidoligase family protein [Candidatus Limivicinus sp.]|jgi:hypothetical protein
MKKIVDFIKNPGLAFISLGHRGFFKNMSDEEYLKIAYRIKMGKTLDLDNPRTFNEKLQWLKIHDRNPLYTMMVDKYEVKKYIAEKIGSEYIIPTIGVWDRFEDIDFDKLPNQFVLKCTHDSGGLVICRDKSKFDIASARRKINSCLRHNYFWGMREWPYKDVKPRIIAEQYIGDSSGNLRDYKFFCFNSEPKFIYLSEGLENHSTAKISFFDLNGNQMKFHRSDFKPFNSEIKMPENFNQMLELSRKLARYVNNQFCRLDFYSVNSCIYFSEITFYPCGGMLPFEPEEWDYRLGSWIKLPEKQ